MTNSFWPTQLGGCARSPAPKAQQCSERCRSKLLQAWNGAVPTLSKLGAVQFQTFPSLARPRSNHSGFSQHRVVTIARLPEPHDDRNGTVPSLEKLGTALLQAWRNLERHRSKLGEVWKGSVPSLEKLGTTPFQALLSFRSLRSCTTSRLREPDNVWNGGVPEFSHRGKVVVEIGIKIFGLLQMGQPN